MESVEKTCFVIQCFDGGKYDRRYSEIYRPAIEGADLRPIRADQVLGVKPIIEVIEEQLSACDAVLADISENNENVFLELGYALSKGKPCVLICDRGARPELPFDVRHRPILFYDTDAPSSFANLSKRITDNLRSEVGKERRIIQSNVSNTSGDTEVADYENLVLGIMLAYAHASNDGVGGYLIGREFDKLGYTGPTLAVALAALSQKGFTESVEMYDERDHEKYLGHRITDAGMRYILDNRHIFAKKQDVSNSSGGLDDEPPF